MESAPLADIWDAAGANGGVKADVSRLAQLIQQGQDPNVANWAGCTPLHCAAPEGNPEITKFLLEHGANVHASTPYGLTPLHFACYHGRLENSQLLLQHGANAHARNTDGFTPKDKAVEGQKTGKFQGPSHKYAEVIDLLSAYEQGGRATQPFPAPIAPAVPAYRNPHPVEPPEVQETHGPAGYHALLHQLELVLQKHKGIPPATTQQGKSELFQMLLGDLAGLAVQFRQPTRAPQPIKTTAPHSWAPITAAALNTAPVPQRATAPQATYQQPTATQQTQSHQAPVSTSTGYHSQRQQQQQTLQQRSKSAATQQAVTQQAPTQTKPPTAGPIVLFNAQSPPAADTASADFYTQQYHKYLESVKTQGAAVTPTDYYNAGRMYSAPTYTPYSVAQSPAVQGTWGQQGFGQAYNPAQPHTNMFGQFGGGNYNPQMYSQSQPRYF